MGRQPVVEVFFELSLQAFTVLKTSWRFSSSFARELASFLSKFDMRRLV